MFSICLGSISACFNFGSIFPLSPETPVFFRCHYNDDTPIRPSMSKPVNFPFLYFFVVTSFFGCCLQLLGIINRKNRLPPKPHAPFFFTARSSRPSPPSPFAPGPAAKDPALREKALLNPFRCVAPDPRTSKTSGAGHCSFHGVGLARILEITYKTHHKTTIPFRPFFLYLEK